MMDIPFTLYMMEQEDIDMCTGEKVDAEDLCYKVAKAFVNDELYEYGKHPYWNKLTSRQKSFFKETVINCCSIPDDEVTIEKIAKELMECLEN